MTKLFKFTFCFLFLHNSLMSCEQHLNKVEISQKIETWLSLEPNIIALSYSTNTPLATIDNEEGRFLAKLAIADKKKYNSIIRNLKKLYKIEKHPIKQEHILKCISYILLNKIETKNIDFRLVTKTSKMLPVFLNEN